MFAIMRSNKTLFAVKTRKFFLPRKKIRTSIHSRYLKRSLSNKQFINNDKQKKFFENVKRTDRNGDETFPVSR